MNPTRLFICIPGDNFSGRFLDCWTSFLSDLQNAGYAVAISRTYHPVVSISRLRCMGGEKEGHKPFNGAPYDWILWIDSDMVWTFADFDRLMKSAIATDAEIMTGLYLMADGRRFCAVETIGQHLTPVDLVGQNSPFEVHYNGLGFALIKRGVFERLTWPWFCGDAIGADGLPQSEDVLFAQQCREIGAPIMADPSVVVGHEKRMVLRP